MITAVRAGHRPYLWVGRMAALKFRRTWAMGLLAGLLVVLIASAALFVATQSPHVATPSSLKQVGDPLPPGAAHCNPIYKEITEPFNAGARGTPLTSCALVEQVRWTTKADHISTSSPPTQLAVVSPITRKQYEMQCISAGSYLTCTGGEDAVVYLYTARS
jgi:hypothetical protein